MVAGIGVWRRVLFKGLLVFEILGGFWYSVGDLLIQCLCFFTVFATNVGVLCYWSFLCFCSLFCASGMSVCGGDCMCVLFAVFFGSYCCFPALLSWC